MLSFIAILQPFRGPFIGEKFKVSAKKTNALNDASLGRSEASEV